MLRGREHFYPAWLELVTAAVAEGTIVDFGTPKPFQKEMAALRDVAARPLYCVDYVPSPEVNVLADAHAMPFRDGSLGAILLSHVLEHVAEPIGVMREVRRVLRPGGKAYVTLLDRGWPYHARAGVYPDYYRFTKDTIDLLFKGWSAVQVLNGGGFAQMLALHVPPKHVERVQRAVNYLDQRRQGERTPIRYVLATL